jgi:hypothetical protein
MRVRFRKSIGGACPPVLITARLRETSAQPHSRESLFRQHRGLEAEFDRPVWFGIGGSAIPRQTLLSAHARIVLGIILGLPETSLSLFLFDIGIAQRSHEEEVPIDRTRHQQAFP